MHAYIDADYGPVNDKVSALLHMRPTLWPFQHYAPLALGRTQAWSWVRQVYGARGACRCMSWNTVRLSCIVIWHGCKNPNGGELWVCHYYHFLSQIQKKDFVYSTGTSTQEKKKKKKTALPGSQYSGGTGSHLVRVDSMYWASLSKWCGGTVLIGTGSYLFLRNYEGTIQVLWHADIQKFCTN